MGEKVAGHEKSIRENESKTLRKQWTQLRDRCGGGARDYTFRNRWNFEEGGTSKREAGVI